MKVSSNLGTKISKLLIYSSIVFSLQSHAFSWQDLWQSKNQQAKEMMKNNEFAKAKNTFHDENWQAIAAFRDKDYQMAANLFANTNSSDANYNLGNALANMGKYKDAILAYDKALTINKHNQDAKYNKEILEKLLQQQEKQKKQKKQNQPKNNESQNQNNPQKSNQKDKKEQKKQLNKNSAQDLGKNNSTSKDDLPKNTENQNPQKFKPENRKNGKQQMQQQWLKLIPDDPGGLLREKFKRDYLRSRGELEQ